MDNILIAKDGYVYTNGDTFGKVIYLGINDSADNWYEITDEEAEVWHIENIQEQINFWQKMVYLINYN